MPRRIRAADQPLTGNRWAAAVIAGLLTGQLIVVAVDCLIGGPGAFAMFGF